MTGSLGMFEGDRHATTLSARSFLAHSESSGGRYGARARFGAGAAAGVVAIYAMGTEFRTDEAVIAMLGTQNEPTKNGASGL